MQAQKHLFPFVVSALCAGQAFAWDHDFTRGLDLYSTSDNGATIRLVCDPNRVYGGTETMVLIVLDGNSDLNAEARLAFAGGSEITVPLIHGRLSKRDLGDVAWQQLLDGLRNSPNAELTVDGNTRAVDFGPPQAFTCL